MEHDNALNHHPINASFYSEHPKVHGPVNIFNTLHYLMAEYSISTGIAKWLRTTPVTERERVEKWLRAHYPVPALA
jgi:hypothetical protein